MIDPTGKAFLPTEDKNLYQGKKALPCIPNRVKSRSGQNALPNSTSGTASASASKSGSTATTTTASNLRCDEPSLRESKPVPPGEKPERQQPVSEPPNSAPPPAQDPATGRWYCPTCGHGHKYRAYIVEHIEQAHGPNAPVEDEDEDDDLA